MDISGEKSDYEEKINISDYLPEGLKLTADSSEDLFIRVNILPEGSSVCEVPTKNIIVENAPDTMQVAFDTAMIEVRVKKTSEDLEDLTEKEIQASIDLEDIEEGSHELPVEIRQNLGDNDHNPDSGSFQDFHSRRKQLNRREFYDQPEDYHYKSFGSSPAARREFV